MKDELPPETVKFLTELSKEDIATLRDGLPIVRMIIGTGAVLRWVAITVLGMMVGTVMLYDSVVKILMWFRHG